MIHMLHLKNAPFSIGKTFVYVFIDKAKYIYIAMLKCNLIEYSGNYSDTSRSLWQFEREEPPNGKADLIAELSHLNIKQLL